MTLLPCWLEIVRPWQAVFAQERTWVRAVRQALGSLLVLGRATVSRILWTNGREQKSWSGEYFLHVVVITLAPLRAVLGARHSLYCSRAFSLARLPGFFTVETSSKRRETTRQHWALAADVRKYQQTLKQNWDPATNGFDFSAAELDGWITRQDLYAAARQAAPHGRNRGTLRN